MLRPLIELLFTIFIIILARAILSSVLKNVARVSLGGLQNQSPRTATTGQQKAQATAGPQIAGELHKDPVCGTYVAESAAVRRQIGARTVFYCSDACRKKDPAGR